MPYLLKNLCINCEGDMEHTFRANDEYGILDDCYELCDQCKQRGTSTQMNCESCKDKDVYCYVEELCNCILPGKEIDFFYRLTIKDPDTELEYCYYKKCYDSCKTCAGPGNVLTHNCDSFILN